MLEHEDIIVGLVFGAKYVAARNQDDGKVQKVVLLFWGCNWQLFARKNLVVVGVK
jgi:hypothetical protein